MRVLYVHSGNLYGGVETLLRTVARERGACPEMEPQFALCFEGRLSDELKEEGVRVHEIGGARVSRPASVWRARRALAALIDEVNADVAVCQSAWSLALLGPAVRAAGVPLVFWLHDSVTGAHWLERWARLVPPDLVICNSRFTAEGARRLYPRARREVVYCPVSTNGDARHPPPSDDTRAAVRAELDTPEDAVVITQVGRMEPLKGHAAHLEALAALRDVPGWTCWQVGGAQRPEEVEYLNGLKSLAARLGVETRVRFAGERTDVGRVLAASDIYCQPNSAPESFGLTFAEAMLARLPVVTTSVGGGAEVVDDSCGLLVPADSSGSAGGADALASALRRLVEDAPLRARLGRNGPARVRQLCDASAQLRKVGGLLGELRGGRGDDGRN